jgi:hypothetical protein
MNGMLKNLKRNCDIMHVAPFATISISNIVFKDAELFSSAFSTAACFSSSATKITPFLLMFIL